MKNSNKDLYNHLGWAVDLLDSISDKFSSNKAISASSSIDPTYLALLSISGLDHAISIIIGALVARATILAANVSIKKA